MRNRILFGGIAAIALALAVLGARPAVAQGYYGGGPGWMGPGMMGGYGLGGGPGWMGPGMMYGYGPGNGGWAPARQTSLDLTVDQVKSNMSRWLAANGNPRVKLGKVVETNPDTISADIVTTDMGVLVQRYAINRHTGYIEPVE